MKIFTALLFFSSMSLAHTVDLTKLPLGDGKISQSPKKEWIWACHTDPNAGGSQKKGPWIRSDGTFDFTAKAVVSGSVQWPHKFSVKRVGDKRVIEANDFPAHTTGTFPIPSTDKAYNYDRNPNKISEQNMRIELDANPKLASAPSCAPGAIGVLLSGSVLFNALDAPGRDAVAHETQDHCQGHPQESGVYHYHSISSCIEDKTDSKGHSALVGYALDGFGIYGRKGVGGKELASSDLDECHGHTHEINWDGRKLEMYHYHATWDFPYTVGCMRGNYKMSDVMTISGPPRGPRHPPDLFQAAKKLGIAESELRKALGPPPPDLEAAAQKLGITVGRLREALGI